MGMVVQAAPSLWLRESYFAGLVFRQMESLHDLSQGCLSSGDMGQPRNVAAAEWVYWVRNVQAVPLAAGAGQQCLHTLGHRNPNQLFPRIHHVADSHRTAEASQALWRPSCPTPAPAGTPGAGAQGHVQAASEHLQGFRPHGLVLWATCASAPAPTMFHFVPLASCPARGLREMTGPLLGRRW